MRRLFFILSIIFIVGCSSQTTTNTNQQPQIIYNIDVTELGDDLFDVTVSASNLTEENNVYNFPATVPGTYQVMNFGRFVESFDAFDDDGNKLGVEQISTNQWKINNISE